MAPTDVILSERVVVQPDLLYITRDRESIIDLDGGVHGAPDLVAEVLSPSTATRDLETKRQIYNRYGVREYWIVDPEEATIDLLTHQGDGLELWQRFTADETLTSPLLPGWRIDVAQMMGDRKPATTEGDGA